MPSLIKEVQIFWAPVPKKGPIKSLKGGEGLGPYRPFSRANPDMYLGPISHNS